MARIERIQIVAEFDLDEEILLTAGTEAKAIQKKFGGKSGTYNVPSAAPPDAPRLMVQSKAFLLNICLSRYDLIVNVPNQIRDAPEKALGFAYSVVMQLEPYLAHVENGCTWLGVIAIVCYRSKDKLRATRITEPIFDHIVNIDREKKDLSSFQLQYGFLEDNCYVTYTVSGYETRSLDIPAMDIQRPGHVRIDLDTGELDESGIQINVDVNNKPNPSQLGFMSDFAAVIAKVGEIVSSLLSRIGLEGIVRDECTR